MRAAIAEDTDHVFFRRMAHSLLRATAERLVTFVTLGMLGCTRHSGIEVCGQVLAGAGWQDTGRLVAPGEHVLCQNDRVTVLRLVPGILVALSDNADVLMKEARLTKDGNDTEERVERRYARLELLHGSLCIAVDAEFGGDLMAQIDTPAGLVSAPAGSLLVLRHSGNGMRLTCVRGPIAIRDADGRETWVQPGYGCQWLADHLDQPGISAPFTARPEFGDDAALCLESEMMMQRLSDTNREK